MEFWVGRAVQLAVTDSPFRARLSLGNCDQVTIFAGGGVYVLGETVNLNPDYWSLNRSPQ